MVANLHFYPLYRHVPKYLLPRGMQVADLNRKRKRRRNKKGTGGERRSDNDPLQSFNDGDVNLEGLEGGDDMDMPDFSQGDTDKEAKKQKRGDGEKKVFTSTKDGTGQSSSGRNAWKEKHRKGKFSNKMRKSEKKIKQPLGI
jgi:hypothetical protein